MLRPHDQKRWAQSYVHTVHMGTIRVDERPVIARTTVSHPSHQPFGDTSVEHAVDLEPEHLDFSTWRDVAKEGYVTNTTTHLPGQNAALTRLRSRGWCGSRRASPPKCPSWSASVAAPKGTSMTSVNVRKPNSQPRTRHTRTREPDPTHSELKHTTTRKPATHERSPDKRQTSFSARCEK